LENPVNLNSKFLILVAMAVLAAAFGVFGLTSLDAGHTMRGLLCYILACSLVTCMCVVAGSAYVAERLAAMHASTVALWKECYAATQAASAEISFSYAGACIPEPKDDPQARQRAELEHILVQGVSRTLADAPGRAAELAQGIKTFMATLHGAASTALPVIDPGPDALEREIQDKANKAPRVTPEALKAEIVSEHYFTGGQGWSAANFGDKNPPATLKLLTFCVLLLRNGTKVVGINYGAIDPKQHCAERGRQEARKQAEEKVWELLGFRLRDELARPMLTEADAAADLAGVPRPA
jgi:hypothetical protein